MKKAALFLIILTFFGDLKSGTLNNDQYVRTEIYPENSIYEKNGEFFFGLKFYLKKGWKTYWKNPGDAGLPIEIDWGKNKKKINYEILFPFPKKYLENDILTIGYEEIVFFPVKISLKDSEVFLQDTIVINYLVCKDICIPISEKKKIKLNFDKVVESEEFLKTLDMIPKIKKTVQISEYKLMDPNNAKFTIKSKDNFKIEQIFAYSAESNLNIKKFNDKVFFLESDEPLDGLKQPIFISLNHGNNFSEIKFYLEKLKQKENIFYFFILAFLGGFILNFMPCVLPVLSLKMISFSSLIEQKSKYIRISSLYTIMGIISSFLLLAMIVILLKSVGLSIGWGFHFQNLYFLVFVTIIILIFTLNMFGFFEIMLPNSLNNNLIDWINKNKKYKDFLSGSLATLLATPCSAPFLGTAVGFAMLGDSLTIITVFLIISVGFSLPYILFIFSPNIVKKFPKSGQWMTKLKYFLGVLLLMTTCWLLNLVGLNLYIIFAFFISILSFSFFKKTLVNGKFWPIFTILLLTVSSLYFIKDDRSSWENFNENNIRNYINNDEIVFLDVTADWCITCQINKITTLNSKKVNRLFINNDIRLVRADWTRKDQRILDFISQYGRYGIPVNIIFSKKLNKEIILPEILSQDILIKRLNEVLDEY